MANGIVHLDVFPDGSEPDSISWKQWNAPHVIYGPSGEVLSFGAIADGEFLKRDGDEIIGGTPAGGGALSVVEFSFDYDELVTLVPSGAVGGDIHIGPNLWIWGISIAVTVVFDDSQAGAGDPPTVETVANDIEYAYCPELTALNSLGLVDGHTQQAPQTSPFWITMRTGASGADFIMNCGNAFLAGDGTQGTIAVSFLVSEA